MKSRKGKYSNYEHCIFRYKVEHHEQVTNSNVNFNGIDIRNEMWPWVYLMKTYVSSRVTWDSIGL